MANRKGRRVDQKKKDHIISVATRIFLNYGFDAASIESIALQADVSKVTIYNHFGDKRGLFTTAFERKFAAIEEQFSFGFKNEGTLEDRLSSIGSTMHLIINSDVMVRLDRRISAEATTHPDISISFLRQGPYKLRERIAEIFAMMMANGELREANPLMAAEQFVSMCKGMGDLERRFGQVTDQSEDVMRIKAAVETFCRAYRSDI